MDTIERVVSRELDIQSGGPEKGNNVDRELHMLKDKLVSLHG